MALYGTEVHTTYYVMRFIVIITAVFLNAVICFAQNDVTKFLGFPVDGPKSEMIKNLKTKGFKLSTFGKTDYLSGRFNGNDVRVYIVTENGKVCRIMVCDANSVNETDIKIRFNKLCSQFKDNGKYCSFGDYTIPENEDISYEMIVNKKRYEALFYQLPEGVNLEQLQTSIIKDVRGKYTPEQLESPTEEILNKISFDTANKTLNVLENKPVWFIISESYGKYYITMFYDNEHNRANGEDL